MYFIIDGLLHNKEIIYVSWFSEKGSLQWNIDVDWWDAGSDGKDGKGADYRVFQEHDVKVMPAGMMRQQYHLTQGRVQDIYGLQDQKFQIEKQVYCCGLIWLIKYPIS